MKKMFYAVKVGRNPGIYTTWEECEQQISGFPGNKYKKFKTFEEAETFLNEDDVIVELVEKALIPESTNNQISELRKQGYTIIFTDGSFIEPYSSWAYIVLDMNDNIVFEQSGLIEDNLESRNIVGEVYAVLAALEYARNNSIYRIAVFHDYEGLSKWYSGEWKAKRDISKLYLERLEEYSDIKILFEHVRGHSGNKFNDYVDKMAAKAIYEKHEPSIISSDKNNIIEDCLKNIFGSNIFIPDSNTLVINGKAGTGKSTKIRQLRRALYENDVNIALTSFMGIAATNIGGVTLHSMFNLFRMDYMNPEDILINHINPNDYEIYNKLDVLVIDEISMVSSYNIETIDMILRRARKSNKPFGGVVTILIGDFYQLPPIIMDNDTKLSGYQDNIRFKQAVIDKFGGVHFFNSTIFKEEIIPIFELSKVFRQDDPTFVELLDLVRIGKKPNNVFEILNTRNIKDDKEINTDRVVYIAETNAKVNQINNEELEKLTTFEKTYVAEITGKYNIKNAPTLEKLNLKIGAKVMILDNNIQEGYNNGTIATVSRFTSNSVYVNLSSALGSREVEITEKEWAEEKYAYNKEQKKFTKETVGSFIQIPLRVAYAITVHKSQGSTLDGVIIDLERAYEAGQVYVALSRVRSLNDIYIKNYLPSSTIYSDEQITRFIEVNKNKDNYYNLKDLVTINL